MQQLVDLEEMYLEHHRALGSSPKTITHYRNTFLIFHLFLESVGKQRIAGELTTATMNGFAAYLRETPARLNRGDTQRSVVTTHGHLKDMRAFVRWLHEEGHIPELPKVPIPKLPQTLFPVLSDAELTLIYQSTQLSTETEIGKRNRALFSFMLDTGVRLAEVTGLKYEDLYLQDGMAKIWGKGSRERFVFYSASTTDYLKLWLSVRGRDEGSLFWLKPAGVRMFLERIKKETGITTLHPHQIRHTALTILVRNKVGIHSVRRMAGHSSLAVTERYLSLSNEDLRQEHQAASPVDQLVARVEPERRGERRLRSRKAA
jgi:site-specific recombinase XerD